MSQCRQCGVVRTTKRLDREVERQKRDAHQKSHEDAGLLRLLFDQKNPSRSHHDADVVYSVERKAVARLSVDGLPLRSALRLAHSRHT
eukprot:4511388-Prymnesium_polylepis.2